MADKPVTEEHQRTAAEIVEACGHTTRRKTWEDAIAQALAEAEARADGDAREEQARMYRGWLESMRQELDASKACIAELEAELEKEKAARHRLRQELCQ